VPKDENPAGIRRDTSGLTLVSRLIPNVPYQWREPEHDEFEQRNVWSLFNAFTAALKDGNLTELPKRTEALHGLLDSHVGLAKKLSAS
jgi:hypothetical protein